MTAGKPEVTFRDVSVHQRRRLKQFFAERIPAVDRKFVNDDHEADYTRLRHYLRENGTFADTWSEWVEALDQDGERVGAFYLSCNATNAGSTEWLQHPRIEPRWLAQYVTDTALLEYIAVTEGNEGQGIGVVLFKHSVNLARQHGSKRLLAGAVSEASRDFLISQGMEAGGWGAPLMPEKNGGVGMRLPGPFAAWCWMEL
ncbi:hypothetical protein [Kocuria sp. TGY1127_2]|uniref:hypothetical protein n=1 Tax=Kocuria sp. TGY1127_2 TaxID=2711328 RepID=UPI001A9C0BD9|nr:hypothetical protein [Kocuria sp. TGY1127_2]